MVRIIVNKNDCKVVNAELYTSGTTGAKLQFEFDTDWNEFTIKKATFIAGDICKTIDIPAPEAGASVSECVIPHEVLAVPDKTLKVGIWGSDGEDVTLPTLYATLGRIFRGADPDGDPTTDPTLPVWAALQARLESISSVGGSGSGSGSGGAMVWRGEYNNSSEYLAGDIVEIQGSVYIKTSHTAAGIAPPGESWELMVSGGKSAYEIAVDNGYVGTPEQWVMAQRGANKLEIGLDGKLYLRDSEGIIADSGVTLPAAGADRLEIGADGKLYLKNETGIISASGITLPEAGANGLIIAGDGKLYLTDNGVVMPYSGVDLPESGVGFSEWHVEQNEEDEKFYLHLIDVNGVDVIEPCEIPATGGGGGAIIDSVVRITNKMPSRALTVVQGVSEYLIGYSWTSTDYITAEDTGDGTATWYVGNTKVQTQSVTQGDCSFNILPYLTAGTSNKVKLVVEDSYGTQKSMTWTITVSVYDLKWLLSDFNVYEDSGVNVRLVPTGTGEMTIHLAIDDTEIFSRTTTASGSALVATISAQTHGAHKISAWITATVEGDTISTVPLVSYGIWTQRNNNTPIIAILDNIVNVSQYSNVRIRYYAYNPAAETASVQISANGYPVSVVEVPKSSQVYTYRAKTAGTDTITFRCGSTVRSAVVTVDSLGVGVEPVTANLVMDFDPVGHSNSESNRNMFGYTDGNGVNHPLGFSSNFDWINGGFQLDDEGVPAFVVKRGTTVTFDTSLFANNAKTHGKEIKIVFKSENVRDYDAQLMSCVNGGIGLVVNAQNATLSSTNEATTIQYIESKKIEMDINIEASNEDKVACIWLEGIPSRAFAYSNNDIWMQGTPANFVVGSEDCDVWLYRVKMYSSSLTKNDILKNYIADCTDVDELTARFDRNNFYNGDGSVNVDALSMNNPDLRIFVIEADRMTTGKSDTVYANVRYVYGRGGTLHNFTAENVKMKAQGTSSLEYILAALNLDLDFSSATSWVNDEGNPLTGYAMTQNSIPVNYINLKANVASSENANNVCLADDYNAYQPYTIPAKAIDQRVRDTVEGHPCAVFFKNTSGSSISVGSRTLAAGDTMLYFVGDMNNSKKNYAVFGQVPSERTLECCIEIMNNNNDQCLFKSDDLTNEYWDAGDDTPSGMVSNFGFRYPKTPTQAMKDKWQQLLTWVKSTDRNAATGSPLIPFVVYDDQPDITYQVDDADYRAAKFKHEVGYYFAVDSLLWHYLFTERHTMIDNRAKNTFCSYNYDDDQDKYLWNFRCDYDNDTADGNDNRGGLTFQYGVEDTDMIGSQNAFNASDSVLWCNVRDCLADELVAMYRNRESAGAWQASRILKKFKDYQSARPEALVADDMWNKYLAPYIAGDTQTFIPMLLGTKEDQRAQFETYQERYMASKYIGSAAREDRIVLRGSTPVSYTGVTPSGDMIITPYADMYINVHYGNAGEGYAISNGDRIRAKRGVPTSVRCPASTLNDTEIDIYSASMISDIDSLAGLYTKTCEISTAVKLQSLNLGSPVAGYVNSSMGVGEGKLSFGNNPLLERIDIRGTPNLKSSLDLSGLTFLKELYATNSGITGVSFAIRSPITTALLPAINNLKAVEVNELSNWILDSSNITSLWIEDSESIDAYSILLTAPNISRGRIIGVQWTGSKSISNADILLPLCSKGGLDNAGEPTDNFVLTGDIHINTVTSSELSALQAAFPDVNFTYTTLASAYTVTFVNYDGTVLDTPQSVRAGASAIDPVASGRIPAPTKPSTTSKSYVYIGWNPSFTNVSGDLTVTALFYETDRKYIVRWFADETTNNKMKEMEVSAFADAVPPSTIPQRTGFIFAGWSHSGRNITSNVDIHPVFASPQKPTAPAPENTYDFLYSDDPDDNSAYTFSELMWIVDSGHADMYIRLYDKIKILCNTDKFTDTVIIMEVAAFKHFKIANSQSFAAVTFLMKGLMNQTYYWNDTGTTVGGWGVSKIRQYLNATVLNGLPYHWQQIIKQVEVLSSEGGGSIGIVSSNNYLWTPSLSETGLRTTTVPYKDEVDSEADELTFAIFSTNDSRKKSVNNNTSTPSSWWTRSVQSRTACVAISTAGDTNNDSWGISASGDLAVCFGFCCGDASANPDVES